MRGYFESLREAPATIPALAAIAVFVVWATDQAGYPVTHWAPGGLVLLALLCIAAGAIGVRAREITRPVKLALAALAAYTVLSFASIAWAAVPGEAWNGADRTLVYLIVFALFACWPQHGASAALLLISWTLAMVGLAAYTGVHLATASGAELSQLALGGRLTFPSGYANANAAEWMMPFWVALLSARSPRLPGVLRGLLAGGAVLLAEIALLSQSRGSLYATPIVVILVFALLPGRVRTFAVLVPIALGVAAGVPFVLRVTQRLEAGGDAHAAAQRALLVVSAAAVVVAVAVSLAALVEHRARLSERSSARIHRGLAIAALATLVAVLAGGWAAAGNPAARIKHDWDTFKGGEEEESTARGDRLLGGLGSSRYDVYRVALDELVAHPLVGLGADNFQEQYLVHGRSKETPRYPHSVEMRTLAETGLLGAVLALLGLGGALLAAGRAIRGPDVLGRAIAAAAIGGFAYWVVHGSVDWFWEFAGLGAPAFALLGLACSLTPRAPASAQVASEHAASEQVASEQVASEQVAPTHVAPGRAARSLVSSVGRRRLIAAAALVVIAAAGSLALPWLSQLELESATRIWTTSPATAFSRLDQAAELDPLSDEPYVVAGDIAVRYDRLTLASHYFARALSRTPHESYALLQLGAIASTLGQRARAVMLLQRAARLDPRNSVTLEALSAARAARAVTVQAVDRAIFEAGARLP